LHNAKTSLTNPPPICATYTCASDGDEQAVSYTLSGFASGGGFSTYVDTPLYQKDAVSGYLKSGVALPPSSYFNGRGRGYPDVSALGHNYVCYISDRNMAVGGTSAATLTFGGVIAVLNDVRIRSGKPQLGFVNTLLYQMAAEKPKTFNDITVGDNICTENGCASTCKGFKCARGWDPITGLGTPNVAEMITYVKSLGHTTL